MRFGRFGMALAASVLAATAAPAADFKWANDGDVRALDPYTFIETVQNSLLADIYERLVQHSRKLGRRRQPLTRDKAALIQGAPHAYGDLLMQRRLTPLVDRPQHKARYY